MSTTVRIAELRKLARRIEQYADSMAAGMLAPEPPDGEEWEHVLTWRYREKEISYAVNQNAGPRELRTMVELLQVSIKRCENELAARGEQP